MCRRSGIGGWAERRLVRGLLDFAEGPRSWPPSVMDSGSALLQHWVWTVRVRRRWGDVGVELGPFGSDLGSAMRPPQPRDGFLPPAGMTAGGSQPASVGPGPPERIE